MPAFDPNFFLYDLGTIESPVIDGIADLWSEDEHEITVAKTRQPLESGATLTDHAVRLPNKLTLTGLASDLGVRGAQRGAESWERIRELMDARTRFNVWTPVGYYADMLITSAKTTRNAGTGGGLIFKIELEEVLLVPLGLDGLPEERLTGEGGDRSGEVARGQVPLHEAEGFDILLLR